MSILFMFKGFLPNALLGRYDCSRPIVKAMLMTASFSPNTEMTRVADIAGWEIAEARGYKPGGIEVRTSIVEGDAYVGLEFGEAVWPDADFTSHGIVYSVSLDGTLIAGHIFDQPLIVRHGGRAIVESSTLAIATGYALVPPGAPQSAGSGGDAKVPAEGLPAL